MKRLKKRFQNLYWQQFLLTAGMVLLTLLLLGVSFYTLSYRYTMQEKRGEMQDRAELVAHMSAPYLVSAEQNEQPDDSLRKLAGVAARMSDVDFLICNRSGKSFKCRQKLYSQSQKDFTIMQVLLSTL